MWNVAWKFLIAMNTTEGDERNEQKGKKVTDASMHPTLPPPSAPPDMQNFAHMDTIEPKVAEIATKSVKYSSSRSATGCCTLSYRRQATIPYMYRMRHCGHATSKILLQHRTLPEHRSFPNTARASPVCSDQADPFWPVSAPTTGSATSCRT
jgi:hypothetical protein